MSFLRRPPHTITVYPVVPVDDGYGGTKPGEGTPVDVLAYVAPRAAPDAEGDAQEGYATTLDYQVVGQKLPAGPWSRVIWDGEDYTVVGEPRRYSRSRRTAHDVALIRRR